MLTVPELVEDMVNAIQEGGRVKTRELNYGPLGELWISTCSGNIMYKRGTDDTVEVTAEQGSGVLVETARMLVYLYSVERENKAKEERQAAELKAAVIKAGKDIEDNCMRLLSTD